MCSNFHNFGVLLAKLTPRCSDPDLVVRQHGIDCVHKLLKIQHRYQGLLHIIDKPFEIINVNDTLTNTGKLHM